MQHLAPGGWEGNPGRYYTEELEEEGFPEELREDDDDDDDDDRSVIWGGRDLAEFAREGGFEGLSSPWNWGGKYGDAAESLLSDSDVEDEFLAELLSRETRGGAEGPPSPPDADAIPNEKEQQRAPPASYPSSGRVVPSPVLPESLLCAPGGGTIGKGINSYRQALGTLGKDISELLEALVASEKKKAEEETGRSKGAGGVLNMIDLEADEPQADDGSSIWSEVNTARCAADDLFNRDKLRTAFDTYMIALDHLAEGIDDVPKQLARPCTRVFCRASFVAHLSYPLETSGERALRMANVAMLLDPDSLEVLFCRGRAYRCLGLHAWASRDLARAREQCGGKAHLADLEAELLNLEQDKERWRDEAKEHQRFEVASMSKDAGDKLYTDGKYQAAALEYLRGLDAYEGNETMVLGNHSRSLQSQLLCLAAQALLKCDDMENSDLMACSVATRALELDSKSVKALLFRGRAYCSLGKLNLACKDFQEVLRMDSYNAEAKQDLEALGHECLATDERSEDPGHTDSRRDADAPAAGERAPDAPEPVDAGLPASAPQPPRQQNAVDTRLPAHERQESDDEEAEEPPAGVGSGADLVVAANAPQPGITPLRAALEAQDVADHLVRKGLFRQSAAAFQRGMQALSESEISCLGPGAYQARELRAELFEGAVESLLRCGESEEVRVLCTQALEKDQQDPKALAWRAAANVQLQEFSLARSDLHNALALEPEDEQAQAEMRQVEELLQLQEELESSETTDSRLFDVMLDAARDDKSEANQFFSQKDYGESFGAYSRGIERFGELKPHHLSAEARELKVALCCSAAQAALLFKDQEGTGLEEALRTVQLALELEPSNVKALFRRGLAYSRSSNWIDARNDFHAVLVLNPEDCNQGKAVVRRFQQQAEQELEKIYKKVPHFPGTCN